MAKETSLRGSDSHSAMAQTLTDQANLAIGEASSVMGAMLSEVLRRGMSSGMLQIGDEVRTFAEGCVDETLQERAPQLEERASEVARETAETTVKDVVDTEVQKAEAHAREGDEKLAAQIEQAKERAEETFRNELRSTLQDLTDRSRKSTNRLKDQVLLLEKIVNGLTLELRSEREARTAAQESLELLEYRIGELEKPRGLSALFAKLCFWKKKKKSRG